MDDGTAVALDLLQHVIQEGSELAHQANDGQEIDAAAVMALRDALAGAHACLARPPVQRSRLYQEAVNRRLAIEMQKQQEINRRLKDLLNQKDDEILRLSQRLINIED